MTCSCNSIKVCVDTCLIVLRDENKVHVRKHNTHSITYDQPHAIWVVVQMGVGTNDMFL